MTANRLLVDRVEEDLRSEAGISPTYYELLALLAGAPGNALRMSELAARSMSKPSRITHAVNRLEQQGLIQREHCPDDRRGWSAALTDSGRAMLAAAAPPHVDSVRAHLIDLLTPAQVRQLGEISDILLRHLAGAPSGAEPHDK